jgi:hypothetical protein
MNKKLKAFTGLFLLPLFCAAQLSWENAESVTGPLPEGIHVYHTSTPVNGKPFKAWYAEIDLRNSSLECDTDTSYKRRLTPGDFYNKSGQPAIVLNATFFSFGTNQNLNLVMKKGRLISYNSTGVKGKGADSMMYLHSFPSAIGIDKKRRADIAWTFTDSNSRKPLATQLAVPPVKTESRNIDRELAVAGTTIVGGRPLSLLEKWKMKTAIGGGPVLVQDGRVYITNNEEIKFAGKAINDAHPRTAMGYTKEGKLIVLAVEGRNPGTAEGATLTELAEIFVALNCVEALNLDGGGSSCLLVNGKETIKPSDKAGQRPVPAVFVVRTRHSSRQVNK